MSMPDFRAQAETLIEGVSDLQRRILIKHTAAILQEIHATINVKRNLLGDDHKRLCDFYGVGNLLALVDAQARHIERLQERLPKDSPMFPGRLREG